MPEVRRTLSVGGQPVHAGPDDPCRWGTAPSTLVRMTLAGGGQPVHTGPDDPCRWGPHPCRRTLGVGEVGRMSCRRGAHIRQRALVRRRLRRLSMSTLCLRIPTSATAEKRTSRLTRASVAAWRGYAGREFVSTSSGGRAIGLASARLSLGGRRWLAGLSGSTCSEQGEALIRQNRLLYASAAPETCAVIQAESRLAVAGAPRCRARPCASFSDGSCTKRSRATTSGRPNRHRLSKVAGCLLRAARVAVPLPW